MTNANIILSGRQVEPLNALMQGTQAADMAMDVRNQRDMRNMLQQYGAGIMSGDQQSLNQLARFDPQAAMSIQSSQLGQEQTRQNMQHANAHQARLSRQERRAMEAHIAQMSAAEIAQEAQHLEGLLKGAAHFYTQGDRRGYDDFLARNGADPTNPEYMFDNYPAAAALYGEAFEILQSFRDMNEPADQFRILSPEEVTQRGLPPGSYQEGPDGKLSQIGGSRTTINNNMGDAGNQLPPPPKDHVYLYDDQGNVLMEPDPSGRGMVPVAHPIFGGPDDNSAKSALSQSGRDTTAEVVFNAFDRANQANNDRVAGGLLGQAAAFNPSSNNAELVRQVDTLKSIAAAENLNAMRQASPTGGALGNASDADIKLLKDKAGALDPASPHFERDLRDYVLTVSRVVHGYEEGTRLFNERYPDQPLDGGDGDNGLSAEDLQYLGVE